MGFGEFLILAFVVLALAWLFVWAIATLLPGTPAIVTNIVWFVAALIIIVTLLRALGFVGHDVAIPRIG